jgi:hypothetical protein
MKFKNLIIMGDLLRPWKNGDQSRSGAFRNVQWLYHLVSRSIESCGLPVTVIDWSRNSINIEYSLFDAAEYYQKKELDISIENWSMLANSSEPCDILISKLEAFFDNSLVLGYEMSKMQIASLDKMGVSYVDIVLHPVRFAYDILHGARTNNLEIHNVLQECHFDQEIIYSAASELMAKISRIPKTINLPMDSSLLLGQVWTDRAVSKSSGGFYRLDDFKAEILNIVNSHAAVVYKPHPYEFVSEQNSGISKIFKSIVPSDLNFYILLCQPTVSSVYGLNSSGLYEAKFFKRDYKYLIPPQYLFNDDVLGENIKVNNFVTLSEIWTKPDFWSMIINGKNIDFSSTKNAMTKNKLRGSMNTDWGYDVIDKLVVKL